MHEPWCNGQECTRNIEVEDGPFINVLLPLYYWSLYDSLDAENWCMRRCVRACWGDATDYDGPAIDGGQYETFRRYLVEGILLFEDGRKGVEEGRANDNQAYKVYLHNGRHGAAGALSDR